MKQAGLIAFLLTLSALLYVGIMLLLGVTTKFKPAAVEEVKLQGKNTAAATLNDTAYTFLIWNVGYGGLGAEVDFFYDGGKMVTSPREHVLKNNKGIEDFLRTQKDVDFFMLQEVDRKSKRSYHTDQAANFAGLFPDYVHAFTPNYDVLFLPFPFTDPIGKVYGGLQTIAAHAAAQSQRIALPGISDFPRKLFYLERCLLLQRYPLANGKELIVINTHFEAYDDGSVKKEQMALTKKLAEAEYAKGNYVIIGGDWNIAPPGFNVHTFEKEPEDEPLYLMTNDANYIPGWTFAYDAATPTNRKNKTPYDAAKTFTTVIDYYLVSPNVEVQEVKGINLNFAYSDHQPVKLRARLK